MDMKAIGRKIIGDAREEMVKDSFISTNFRIENSGEWKSGIVEEYHERLVLYPEDHWIDSCGNGFSIEYFSKADDMPCLVFGIRSPYTAPRNMEFSEELVDITEKTLKAHRIPYETLHSSVVMDSYWRIWTIIAEIDNEDFNVTDVVKKAISLMNEVFVEREKIVRPDYLIF